MADTRREYGELNFVSDFRTFLMIVIDASRESAPVTIGVKKMTASCLDIVRKIEFD